jgi:membrane-bound lytic murein transglycosylase D
MMQAIKKTGSLDFDKTILYYESPSFGFASKNFYGEFIAARRVYYKIKNLIQIKFKPNNLDSIVIDPPLSLKDLAKESGLEIEEISRYNQCILPETISQNPDKPLPKFFEFFAPKTPIQKLRKKMAQQISHNRQI